MTVDTYNPNEGGIALLKGLILVGFILVVLIVAGIVYGDILNTKHADTSHSEQTWNTASIKQAFDSGQCRPNIDACDGFEYHYCTLDDGVTTIGLVIAAADEALGYVEEVITGYQGSETHWSSKCDG